MATANAELKAKISLNRSAFTRGLADAGRDATSWARGVAANTGQILAGIGKIGIGTGIAAGIGTIGGIGMAISKAMDAETIKVQFETLLGSADKAQKRLEELTTFAAKTPFEMPEISAASKMLEVMAGSTLSTGKGLTMVGDVAAASGASFEEAARAIGRLYSNLQNNRPAGEALQRLGEIGAISGETRGKIEALVEAGNGKQAWDVATAGFARFAGGMEKLSMTMSGMLSTLRDGVSGLFRAVGVPINDALKPIILAVSNTVEGLTKQAGELGTKIANGIKVGTELFRNGDLGKFLEAALMTGLAKAGNFAIGMVTTITEFLARELTTSTGQMIKGLSTGAVAFGLLFTAGIQDGMGNVQEEINKWATDKKKEMVDNAPLPFKPMVSLASHAYDPLVNATDSGLFGDKNPLKSSGANLRELARGMLASAGGDIGAAIRSTAENTGKARANFKTSDAFGNYDKSGEMMMHLEKAAAGLPDKNRRKSTPFENPFKPGEMVGGTMPGSIEEIKTAALGIQKAIEKLLQPATP